MCWDYHVIAIRSKVIHAENGVQKKSTQVLDVDTWVTPYPCSLEEYLQQSFPHATTTNQVDECYLPLFRVVDAKEYLKHFYSDRSHMYIDGQWSAPPPNYKPIMNGLEFDAQSGEGESAKDGKVSNLEYYINMSEELTEDDSNLRPLSLDEFRNRFIE